MHAQAALVAEAQVELLPRPGRAQRSSKVSSSRLSAALGRSSAAAAGADLARIAGADHVRGR